MLAFVGDRDWREALLEGARDVPETVRRLGPAGLERSYGPGKWKGKQVLAHLADAEIAVGFRYRQILTQQPHIIQEYDETAWIRLYDRTKNIDVQAALQSFLATRRWNHHLFHALTAEQLNRVGTHPARGDESLEMGIRRPGRATRTTTSGNWNCCRRSESPGRVAAERRKNAALARQPMVLRTSPRSSRRSGERSSYAEHDARPHKGTG